MGLETATLAVGMLIGGVIGRWWALALAVPAGLVGASAHSFEGLWSVEVGVLFGLAGAIGLAAGVAVRKGFGRWSKRSD